MSDAHPVPADDVINRLAGLAATSPLAALRMQRPEAVKAIAASRQALLDPPDDGGLTRLERTAVALRVATLDGNEALKTYYREAFLASGAPFDAAAVATGSTTPSLPARLAAMLRHAEMLVLEPVAAKPAHVAALAEAGLTPRQIVTLSQLIAFVTFESRLLAGLSLLETA